MNKKKNKLAKKKEENKERKKVKEEWKRKKKLRLRDQIGKLIKKKKNYRFYQSCLSVIQHTIIGLVKSSLSTCGSNEFIILMKEGIWVE